MSLPVTTQALGRPDPSDKARLTGVRPIVSRLEGMARADGVATVVTCGLILLSALVLTLTRSTNIDVSWLLSVGERWLSGERLYVDVIEVNPPASVLIYMPAVLLARLLGWSSETSVVVLVLAGCVASLGLSILVLRGSNLGRRHGSGLALCGALVLLCLAPTGNFAEREHIALLAALPWLAAVAARSEGHVPPLGLALLVGLGGGIAMAIKPMFVLGFAGPLLFVLVRQGWKCLAFAWDLHAAWLTTGLYGLAVLTLFPVFVRDPLPWVLAAYVPVRLSLTVLLSLGVTSVWAALLVCTALVWRRQRADALPIVLLLSSLGFGTVFLMQAKGWSYQALPAILLAALACWFSLAGAVRTWAGLRALLPLVIGCLAFAVLSAVQFRTTSSGARLPGLAAAIEREAPHPRMMSISSDIAAGHPLVREVGGRWVGTFCSLWLTSGFVAQDTAGGLSPAARTRLIALSEREHDIVLSDIRTRDPDVILIQDGWRKGYADGHPDLETALDGYRDAGHFGILALYVRRADGPRS